MVLGGQGYMTIYTDDYWMQRALELAQQGMATAEVPVGAIVVLDNKIVGQGYNCPIAKQDPTAHAEIIAMRNAAQHLKNYRLINTTLYVTLEPCPMCAGAMLQARIKRLVYGTVDLKGGAVSSKLELFGHKWNHDIVCSSGILAEPCANILREFFQARR